MEVKISIGIPFYVPLKHPKHIMGWRKNLLQLIVALFQVCITSYVFLYRWFHQTAKSSSEKENPKEISVKTLWIWRPVLLFKGSALYKLVVRVFWRIICIMFYSTLPLSPPPGAPLEIKLVFRTGIDKSLVVMYNVVEKEFPSWIQQQHIMINGCIDLSLHKSAWIDDK